MRGPLLLCLLLLAAASPLRARQVSPRDRPRVSVGRIAERTVSVGTLVAVDDATLVLQR